MCLNIKNKIKNIDIKLGNVYLIFGDNYLLINKYKNKILNKKKYNKLKNINFIINNNVNWDLIIYEINNLDLFYKYKIITFYIKKNNTVYIDKILKMILNINNRIIINIIINKIINIEKYKYLIIKNKNFFLIKCIIPNFLSLIKSIEQYINKINLKLNKLEYKILLNIYEGNLLQLIEILINLKNRPFNKKMNFKNLENILLMSSKFTTKQWINAVIIGNYHRACFILKRFKIEQKNILYIIYKFQLIFIKIIKIFEEKDKYTFLYLFKKYKIDKNITNKLHIILKKIDLKRLIKINKIICTIQYISRKEKFKENLWTLLNILNIQFIN